jgi:hypothetical protein
MLSDERMGGAIEIPRGMKFSMSAACVTSVVSIHCQDCQGRPESKGSHVHLGIANPEWINLKKYASGVHSAHMISRVRAVVNQIFARHDMEKKYATAHIRSSALMNEGKVSEWYHMIRIHSQFRDHTTFLR